jgi:hypothetical protein
LVNGDEIGLLNALNQKLRYAVANFNLKFLGGRVIERNHYFATITGINGAGGIQNSYSVL